MADEKEISTMRVITKAVLNIASLTWLAVTSYQYEGAIALCKGDQTAKDAEKQTLSFDQQLMTIFNKQYATQSANLQFLQSSLQPTIAAGGTGYTPEQLAAQRTGATDTDSEAFQSAQAALNNEISQQSGGAKLTGVAGATTEADAALLNAEAQKQSSDQNAITTNNANLQQSNYWNAVNALNGVAAQNNPLGYAQSSNGAGSTITGLSQAFTASNQSQILGALGGIAGGAGTALAGAKL
jgi:hypothetical protein